MGNNHVLKKVDSNDEEEAEFGSFNWKSNLSVQKLLDVVVSILADEYVQTARLNPEVFENDEGEG